MFDSCDRRVSEQTDSEYCEKHYSQIKHDYLSLPKEWRNVFLSGLYAADIERLKEDGIIK